MKSTEDTEPVYCLIVDDLEENLVSLEALLRRDGLVLLRARSGEDALELLLQYEVALAILDVQMPSMDGFELAELMRGNERTRRVPIIFLTAGSADLQRRFRGYEAGAVDFLQKPIEPEILRSKAEVFFELYLQRRELARHRDMLKAHAVSLEEADRRKDEFLAMLAHELRNPLTPIRYGLEILKVSPNHPSADEVRSMMERQLTHLVRLIDDLLDVSRIGRGTIDLRKERVELSALLQAAMEASLPLIEARNHAFEKRLPTERILLTADATRIAQVVSNLLNNAAKYTPDGGRIELEVEVKEQELAIHVTDNGLGISEEMLPHIFDLFIQVDRQDDRSGGGLGIGLALARQLAELHGGRITVASEGTGKGSRFTLWLPLGEEGGEPQDMAPDPSQELAPLRVLVVDDDANSAQATAQILEIIGHQVVRAHDGPTALEMAETFRPDVVVLDIGMPGMSGYEVCRKLRKNPQLGETLFIAQTGWGQSRDRDLSREAGFDHHLTKPVSIDELKALIARRRGSA